MCCSLNNKIIGSSHRNVHIMKIHTYILYKFSLILCNRILINGRWKSDTWLGRISLPFNPGSYNQFSVKAVWQAGNYFFDLRVPNTRSSIKLARFIIFQAPLIFKSIVLHSDTAIKWAENGITRWETSRLTNRIQERDSLSSSLHRSFQASSVPYYTRQTNQNPHECRWHFICLARFKI